MPRIVQATVAEQRRWRRAALLHAAKEVVVERGVDQWSVRALAERAGVSRAAVYEYFVSGDQILAEVLLDELERLADDLRLSQASSVDPQNKLQSWVECNLAYVADGSHSLARALMPVAASTDLRGEIERAHRVLYGTISETLAQIGVRDVAMALTWVAAILESAAKKIEGGAPFTEVRDSATAFINAGVKALSASQSRS